MTLLLLLIDFIHRISYNCLYKSYLQADMKEKNFSVIFIVILFLSGSGFYLCTRLQLPQNCRQFVDELPSTFLDFDSSVNLTFNALMKTHNCMEKQNISFLQSSEMRNKYYAFYYLI